MTEQKFFRAVLFDMDGTLTDTLMIHFHSLNDALLEHGEEYRVSKDDWHKWEGYTASAILEELTKDRGLPVERYSWILRRKQLFTLRRIEKQLEPDYHKVALLNSLRQREVKVAVCSNANRSIVNAALKKTGLFDLVDVVLSRDDVKCPKPDPEIFNQAAERLGIPIEDCVIVEDSSLGLEAARAAKAGMVVAVDGPQDVTAVMF